MSHSMPPKLSATPRAFFHVIGSLRNMAATNMVKIGVVVLITERSTGVVWAMAWRKVSCGRKRPSMPAPASRSKSRGGTFSRGAKSDTSQNSAPATSDRMANNTIGAMPPSVAISRQTTTLMPKMTYAAAAAK